nr:hypothetical protein BAR15_110004 [Bartonella sp. AR 15-3]
MFVLLFCHFNRYNDILNLPLKIITSVEEEESPFDIKEIEALNLSRKNECETMIRLSDISICIKGIGYFQSDRTFMY